MKKQNAHAAATHKYNQKNTVQIPIRLNKGTDADILAHLDGLQNKQGYIKELIRRDMAKRKYREAAPE